MRLALALVAGCALSSASAQSPENPYVLRIDKARYALSVPTTGVAGVSAAAGSSAPQIPPVAVRHAMPDEQWRARELEYDRRIRQLVQERDAWKLRADLLESQLMTNRRP